MSKLTVYEDQDFNTPALVTEDSAKIADLLNEKGVRFEHWPTQSLSANAEQEEILAAYSADVSRLKNECGFTTADVVKLTPDNLQKDEFRKKFLAEHIHVEDEVRFFVEGQGLFFLNIDSKVYVVLCQKNDLISVPDGVTHWFDMGPKPSFTCIRLFTNPKGWVAEFTGSTIADQVPGWEQLMETAE
ncbi:1,2-dihydroxy-3-keto-5-methylthiopentene dioxygenase [Alkalimarinus alittae]|uniref:Acireductone dioxygenase n=1 Tax=Alkalimarinus alittae TaxID=2961619 RepID=A0ABY6N5C6_9ALTE|nr:acireductone dioxygenase [Alkalimarinus alittae]UZE97331.1 acireductone dioxygenase [Alkalimarinus alittae]